jgi:hypothetical protein
LVMFPSLLLGLLVYVLVLSGRKVRTLYQTHPVSEDKGDDLFDGIVAGGEDGLREEQKLNAERNRKSNEQLGGGRGSLLVTENHVHSSLTREGQACRDALLVKELEVLDFESSLNESCLGLETGMNSPDVGLGEASSEDQVEWSDSSGEMRLNSSPSFSSPSPSSSSSFCDSIFSSSSNSH